MPQTKTKRAKASKAKNPLGRNPDAIPLDDMLDHLDKHAEAIGTFLVGQNDAWVATDAKLVTEHVQSRIDGVTENIRRLGTKTNTQVKAHQIADAIEKRSIPTPPWLTHPAKVSGKWHSPIVTKKADRRGNEVPVEIGYCDYRLLVYPHRTQLDDEPFFDALTRGKAAARSQETARFTDWLNWITPEIVANAPDFVWELAPTSEPLIFYIFCCTDSSDRSAFIRRLRPFEDALPDKNILVCTADERAAKTLLSQGFGTISYPTFSCNAWPTDTSRSGLGVDFSDIGFKMPWGSSLFAMATNY